MVRVGGAEGEFNVYIFNKEQLKPWRKRRQFALLRERIYPDICCYDRSMVAVFGVKVLAGRAIVTALVYQSTKYPTTLEY